MAIYWIYDFEVDFWEVINGDFRLFIYLSYFEKYGCYKPIPYGEFEEENMITSESCVAVWSLSQREEQHADSIFDIGSSVE